MSLTACAETWTCEVRTRDGRLPDVRVMATGIRDLGAGATLRGVEATIDGWLVRRNGRVALRMSRTGGVVYLAPLGRKVQWDARFGRCESPTDAERTAYERLTAISTGRPRQVRIVGPLVDVGAGKAPLLEVREFIWRR